MFFAAMVTGLQTALTLDANPISSGKKRGFSSFLFITRRPFAGVDYRKPPTVTYRRRGDASRGRVALRG